MRKNDAAVILIIAALFGTYILSFVRERHGAEKREAVRSALINPGNIPSITLMEIGGEIELAKRGDFWTVSEAGNPDVFFPADSGRIADFLAEFSKVRVMYKISDKAGGQDSFGFSDSSAFSVRYYYDGGDDTLLFGNQDFSLSARYMMSARTGAVYEINNEVQRFLSSSVQFWAEPYLVSRETIGIGDLSDALQRVIVDGVVSHGGPDARLLELRHGGLPDALDIRFVSDGLAASMTMTLEFGDKSSVMMEFFPLESGAGYAVRQIYESGAGRKNQFWAKISAWTYSRIREITL